MGEACGDETAVQPLLEVSPDAALHGAMALAIDFDMGVVAGMLLDRDASLCDRPFAYGKLPLVRAVGMRHYAAAAALARRRTANPAAHVRALARNATSENLIAEVLKANAGTMDADEWAETMACVPPDCPALANAFDAVVAHAPDMLGPLVRRLPLGDVRTVRAALLVMQSGRLALPWSEHGLYLPHTLCLEILRRVF